MVAQGKEEQTYLRRVEKKIDKGELGAPVFGILKGMAEFRPHVGSGGLSKV